MEKQGADALGVQVLQQFFVTVTRKVEPHLPVDEAAERVGELATWEVFTPTQMMSLPRSRSRSDKPIFGFRW
jgi:hypothetical protein